MLRWLIWAGLAFIVGGVTSLAITIGVEGEFRPLEGLSSYSIGWIIAGIVMIILGFVMKSKQKRVE